MNRVLGAVLGVLLVAVLAVGPVGPAVTPAGAAPVCDTYGLGKKIPVLLVHGFLSSADTWDRAVYRRGGELPQAPGTFITEPFDYSAEATEWIQGNAKSSAARRLGERIQCLAQASAKNGGPGRVALVGHSMGGLLLRCALTPTCSKGPDIAAVAGQVVTIGTPSLGSFLRPNGVASSAVSAFGRVVQAQCAAERAMGRVPGPVGSVMKVKAWAGQGLCDVMDKLTNSSAGRAFTVGSRELAALPPWPAGVPIRTVAASIDFVYQVLFWQAASVNVGDAVVGVDSASSGAGSAPLGGTAVRDCGDLRLTETLVAAPHVPAVSSVPNCHHVSEPGDREIADMVGRAVGAWWAHVNRPVSADELRSAPVPPLCRFPAGRLVDGRLPNQPASAGEPPTLITGRNGNSLVALGDLDGTGAADGAAVVNCNAGGVGWPDSIVFWAAGPEGPRLLGAYDMVDAVGDARGGTTRLTYGRGGTVVVESLDAREWDSGCCPSGRARVTLAWDGRNVVAREVQHLGGPADLTFAGVGQVRLGMTAQQLEELGYTAGDGDYYGCVSYSGGDDDPLVTYSPPEDAVVKIIPQGSAQTVEGLQVGSSLDSVRQTYAGRTIEDYLDSSFGQGMSGLLVGDGSGGWISFVTDDGFFVSSMSVSDHEHYGALEAGCE
jgi:pimeloyl-ACP methyl ester carboxylesterase